jgi:hypothetical protein
MTVGQRRRRGAGPLVRPTPDLSTTGWQTRSAYGACYAAYRFYPPGLWLSLDRHRADLQDLLFNEPWFFIEGCLWAVFALTALQPASRRPWGRSAVAVCLLAAVFGVLSGLGAIPTVGHRDAPLDTVLPNHRPAMAVQDSASMRAIAELDPAGYRARRSPACGAGLDAPSAARSPGRRPRPSSAPA